MTNNYGLAISNFFCGKSFFVLPLFRNVNRLTAEYEHNEYEILSKRNAKTNSCRFLNHLVHGGILGL